VYIFIIKKTFLSINNKLSAINGERNYSYKNCIPVDNFQKFVKKYFVVFSTAYLPPIEFFIYAFLDGEITIEACENYIKQSYRNRCCIYSANGIYNLIIPIDHEGKLHIPIGEVKISYTEPWQRMHWRAITSAYNKSAFFLYYRDHFERFYSDKQKWLIDFNHDIIVECLKLLKLKKSINYTTEFIKLPEANDLRTRINPKINSEIVFPSYTQAFDIKYGFLKNLSIIDLLFNCGPDSQDYIGNAAGKIKV